MEYVFHKLIPIKEVEKDWFKLKWKPTKNGTWNFYVVKSCSKRFLIKLRDSSAHNGWYRSWDGFSVTIQLGKRICQFWIHYNLICHKTGAADVRTIIPLDFSKSKFKISNGNLKNP